ncbi:MAG: HAMP domain-containing sensor histidine kinase [Erysipelotrichaceae bacterium]|nr:HAMP domain-containing sensor histidine kinase [Erysipelotrichaceae bacterium]
MKKLNVKQKLAELKAHRNSIQVKIFKYFTFFSIIIIVVLWLFQITGLKTFYRYMTIRNIKNTAEIIEDNLDNTSLSVLIRRLAINNDFSIRVISVSDNSLDYTVDNSSFSIFLSQLNTTDITNYYNLTLQNNGSYTLIIEKSTFYNDSYDSKTFKGPVPDETKGFDDHVVYSQLIKNGDNTYLFLGYAQLAPVESTISILKTQIIFVSLFFVLLSVMFTLFISKKITKPIVEINNSAKILATGNYDVNFTGNGYAEIIELNDTLNYATKELKKVDDLRNELIANISHDLRTPLTLISGYSEIMRDIPQENTPENLQIIVDEANRLSSIVDDILELSKFQANVNILQPKDYNITEDIRSIINRYVKLYQDGYQIIFNYDNDITISADPIKISQVLYNLLNNAINYSQQQKRIVINQLAIDSYVTIEVINFGKQIDVDEIQFVFDRYYRSKENHVRAVVGSGLGLSIVKSIVKMHGGEVSVESNSEFTKFSFTLPSGGLDKNRSL